MVPLLHDRRIFDGRNQTTIERKRHGQRQSGHGSGTGGGARHRSHHDRPVLRRKQNYAGDDRIQQCNAELPAAYNRSTACIGLVKSDGGNQDSRDGDDPLEFLQDGYKKLPLATSLTQTFSPAENNALTRKITIGEPDAQGVYHVADIIQDAKWMVYEEETFDTGRVHRRAGVMQVTGNEPDQQERGSVTGRALTVEWMKDPLYVDAEHPNTRWIESWYDPKA